MISVLDLVYGGVTVSCMGVWIKHGLLGTIKCHFQRIVLNGIRFRLSKSWCKRLKNMCFLWFVKRDYM